MIVDITETIREKGIKIISPVKMSDGILGKIAVKDGETVFFIKKNINDVRKRFILAHMFAHIILKHKIPRTEVTENMYAESGGEEGNANKKALEILIPEKILKCLVYNGGITSVKKLAPIFGVSEAAMVERMKHLKMIKG
jgi:Zn-dependent peptidase ImmA (M78 family)